MIKDSGNRTEFSSGAVRDIQKGKGRFDLVPMEIMARETDSYIIGNIWLFSESRDVNHLYNILVSTHEKTEVDFVEKRIEPMFPDKYTMWLEVAKHFEEGAEKYGEHNWEKGLPIECYINSMTRHYLKWLRGDTDERHDRAFAWNVICCIWTLENSKTEPIQTELCNMHKDSKPNKIKRIFKMHKYT